MNTYSDVIEYLDSLPEEPGAIALHKIRSDLQAVANSISERGEEVDTELSAELAALAFVEDYSEGHWGTYYGPMFVLPNEEGQMVEYPSIHALSNSTIQYWQERAQNAKHPCLRLRYADLVWDLSEPVSGHRPNYQIAQIAIDGTIEAASKRLYKHDVVTIKKLKRALELALSLNDENRIAEVRDAIIEFEDQVGEDDLPGTWGFSFDCLVEKRNIPLSDEQLYSIFNNIEARLDTFANRASPGTTEITAAESAAIRLDKYYQSKGIMDDAHRVVRKYAEVVVNSVEGLEPLVAHHWLRHLFDFLTSRGMNEDAEALTDLLQSAGKRTIENLSEISQEIQIPQEEIDAYYDSFKGDSLAESLTRIAAHFVPDSERVTQQLMDLAKKAPLQALISHTVLDHEGRPVSQIGSVENDLEGRVIQQTSQNMQIEKFFLSGAIDAVLDHYDLGHEDLVNHLLQSPVFNSEMRPALEAGLSAYLREDYISSVSVLIPQIEAAIRHLANLVGLPLYRRGRHGDLLLRNLDDLMRDEVISQILGTRMSSYLLLLLTDQRGWNLRNIVCHGLVPSTMLGRLQADRVLHALLLISIVRKSVDPDS